MNWEAYCEACKPEQPDGQVFLLEPPDDIPGAKPPPIPCECGRQAKWLVIK